MERQDESADEWAARSLDESERYLRDAERDASLSYGGDLGSAAGGAALAAALLAVLVHVGRRLYRVIRKERRPR